ncbi:CBS domain-containing protein [Trujillonella endophytica]|uniref:CBS domain-containing protein n=1 Tax=Trujillonella endophytica TaxID=673521 RepID=A0A1H8SY84_9ACTN|nr:CBS domain-containing protein [Trujillella endophytica]SEO83446.1 CBS domain-containing protein [Trujillella endophytica]
MQVRDVMTRQVVTVGPETSVKYAGEVLAEHGFAALPVVDDESRLVGIVAEADVLRDRVPRDPRLHLRRETEEDRVLPLLVRGVMTDGVRTVDPTADVSDVAGLLVEERLRSVPVVDGEQLVGIVSRRDLLKALVRTDDAIRADLTDLVERYTGEVGAWDVAVAEGVATVRRARGESQDPPGTEERALSALARTVGGVVAVDILPPRTAGGR